MVIALGAQARMPLFGQRPPTPGRQDACTPRRAIISQAYFATVAPDPRLSAV